MTSLLLTFPYPQGPERMRAASHFDTKFKTILSI